jgi:hypothetical protein
MTALNVATAWQPPPEQRADEYLNNSERVALIENRVLTDDEFKRFCAALGLPPDVALTLTKEGANRGYLALRRWFAIKAFSLSNFTAAVETLSPTLSTTSA